MTQIHHNLIAVYCISAGKTPTRERVIFFEQFHCKINLKGDKKTKTEMQHLSEVANLAELNCSTVLMWIL